MLFPAQVYPKKAVADQSAVLRVTEFETTVIIGRDHPAEQNEELARSDEESARLNKGNPLMNLFRIRETQRFPISISEAWSFFSNPKNLQRITPPSLGLEITSDVPEKMYPGMIITYRVRPVLGIPMQWITEITHVVEPHLFIDEQRFGPYRFWHHQHLFKEIDGGVEATDIVHYGLRGGPFARVANEVVVRKQLWRIFEFRNRYMEELFGKLPRG